MTRIKYSGRITPNCPYHGSLLLTQGRIVAPTTIMPPNPEWGPVAQYGPSAILKTYSLTQIKNYRP